MFNIMANAASVHGASIMSDMRSSYMSTPGKVLHPSHLSDGYVVCTELKV